MMTEKPIEPHKKVQESKRTEGNLNAPLVSIIVPVYKMETYLAQCLDSILGQSLKEIELICVDDGSFGRIPEILADYAARDLRVKIVTQANLGISAARNAGLAAATAPYVAFVDYDDWIEPTTYETAVAMIKSAPDIDLAGWRARPFGAAENHVLLKDVSKLACEEGPFSINERTLIQLNYHHYYYVWNKLLKRDIITKNNIEFTNVPGEDVIFMLEYLLYTRRAFFTKESLYHYRLHELSLTGQTATSAPGEFFDYGGGISAQKGFIGLVLWENVLTKYKQRNFLEKYKKILSQAIFKVLSSEYDTVIDKNSFLDRLEGMVKQYDLPAKYLTEIAKSRKLGYFYPKKLSWLERIFSVKNAGAKKIICVIGLRFTVNRRKRNSPEFEQ